MDHNIHVRCYHLFPQSDLPRRKIIEMRKVLLPCDSFPWFHSNRIILQVSIFAFCNVILQYANESCIWFLMKLWLLCASNCHGKIGYFLPSCLLNHWHRQCISCSRYEANQVNIVYKFHITVQIMLKSHVALPLREKFYVEFSFIFLSRDIAWQISG